MQKVLILLCQCIICKNLFIYLFIFNLFTVDKFISVTSRTAFHKEYSNNYSMTSGSLWNYYGDELINSAIEIKNNSNNINSNKKATNKFFKNKTKLIGSMPKNINILDTEVVAPLKYLCNFWRSLDLPLINCEIELDLRQANKLGNM